VQCESYTVRRSPSQRKILFRHFSKWGWYFSISETIGKNKPVVGEKCILNNAGELAVTDEDKMRSKIREIVNINEMQFGFVPGRGTTDAIFITRQLQEKYIAAKKFLYFAFIDLEKAFDRVPISSS